VGQRGGGGGGGTGLCAAEVLWLACLGELCGLLWVVELVAVKKANAEDVSMWNIRCRCGSSSAQLVDPKLSGVKTQNGANDCAAPLSWAQDGNARASA